MAFKSDVVYKFMPSTRITILESETLDDDDDDDDMKENPGSLVTSTLKPSPTTRLLLETVRMASAGKDIPRTFLLTGPPGVGKTHAVRTTVQQSPFDVHLVALHGSDILASGSHPSEAARNLRAHFLNAARLTLRTTTTNVALLFLDECEALTSSDVVAAMLGHLLDRISAEWKRMIVIAATNRIDALPAWLRRPGRFDREIPLAPPGAPQREEILRNLLEEQQQERFPKAIPPLTKVADACVGYVPADLAALVRRASLVSVRQKDSVITEEALLAAMSEVGASVSFSRFQNALFSKCCFY